MSANENACDIKMGYDPADELLSIDDVMKLKLRVAEVIEAIPHPNADRLLVLKIRVGDRVKTICAGVRKHYDPLLLVGKRIIVVDNLKPVMLRGVESQGMLLAASAEDQLTLLTTDNPGFPSGAVIK